MPSNTHRTLERGAKQRGKVAHTARPGKPEGNEGKGEDEQASAKKGGRSARTRPSEMTNGALSRLRESVPTPQVLNLMGSSTEDVNLRPLGERLR